MKKKDVAVIVLIIGISLMASYFGINALLSKSKAASLKVKTVTLINNQINDPNPEIFNDNAINPAVQIIIGN